MPQIIKALTGSFAVCTVISALIALFWLRIPRPAAATEQTLAVAAR